MADFQTDLPKGRWDVPFFAERFLGIRLNPGQKRLARAYLRRNKTGWRAAYLWLMVSAGNRAGKTLILTILVLHSCVYKMGQEPPDPDKPASIKRWLELDYDWYHFGLQQENADVVFEEIQKMLEGTHEAQKERDANGDPIGCPLATEMGLDNIIAQPFDKKYKGEYPWIVLHKNLGGAQIHFRSVNAKALGALGRDMHGVSFDEAGIVGSFLPFLLNEVLHLRRLGTGGQFILISTPSEAIGPEFADLWYTGDPESGDYTPGRFSMRMSSRDNIGFGLDQDVFDTLIEGMDPEVIKQNIDGHFIQGRSAYFNAGSVDKCFVTWLPERMPAKKGHQYAQGVDPAKSVDSAWSIVLDILIQEATGKPIGVGVYAEQTRGKLTTPELVALAATPQNSYDNPRRGSRCTTGADVTGFGGKMFKEAVEEEVPTIINIEFGGSIAKKRKLLGDLRTMMDEGRLFFPRHGVWMQLRRQLLGYKLEDRKIEQDGVMASTCAVHVLRRVAGATEDGVPFDARDTGTGRELSATDGRRWARTPYRHRARVAE